MPEVVTSIDGFVSDVLQIPVLFPDKVTLPPSQNVVALPALIVDAIGNGFTISVIILLAALPQIVVFTAWYVPAADIVGEEFELNDVKPPL